MATKALYQHLPNRMLCLFVALLFFWSILEIMADITLLMPLSRIAFGIGLVSIYGLNFWVLFIVSRSPVGIFAWHKYGLVLILGYTALTQAIFFPTPQMRYVFLLTFIYLLTIIRVIKVEKPLRKVIRWVYRALATALVTLLGLACIVQGLNFAYDLHAETSIYSLNETPDHTKVLSIIAVDSGALGMDFYANHSKCYGGFLKISRHMGIIDQPAEIRWINDGEVAIGNQRFILPWLP